MPPIVDRLPLSHPVVLPRHRTIRRQVLGAAVEAAADAAYKQAAEFYEEVMATYVLRPLFPRKCRMPTIRHPPPMTR